MNAALPAVVVPSSVIRQMAVAKAATSRDALRAATLEALCDFICANIRGFMLFEPETPEPLYPYGFRVVTTQTGCRRAFAKGAEE